MLDAARHFVYPPTPALAEAVRLRLARRPRPVRLRWAALLLAGSLAIPQVRAAVWDALRLGALHILVGSTTPTDYPPPLETPLEMGGETTLNEAERVTGRGLPLPGYPEGIGAPDRVFLQDDGGWLVTLLWLLPDEDGAPWLLIEAMDTRVIGQKFSLEGAQAVMVNERPVYWLMGGHDLAYIFASGIISRRVSQPTLIWEADDVTYRIETALDQAEVVRMAESMR